MNIKTLLFVAMVSQGLNADVVRSEPADHPLRIAQFEEAMDSVKHNWLVSLNAHYNRLDRGHVDGCTLLHYAVITNRPDWVSSLLEAGANPLVANNAGLTPVHMAANDDRLEILKIFLDEGLVNVRALIPTVNTPSLFAHPSQLGATVLHWAVLLEQKATILALLQNGADLYALNLRGETPLFIACKKRRQRSLIVPIVREALLRNTLGLDLNDLIGGLLGDIPLRQPVIDAVRRIYIRCTRPPAIRVAASSPADAARMPADAPSFEQRRRREYHQPEGHEAKPAGHKRVLERQNAFYIDPNTIN